MPVPGANLKTVLLGSLFQPWEFSQHHIYFQQGSIRVRLYATVGLRIWLGAEHTYG
jgi:hypothetical protein